MADPFRDYIDKKVDEMMREATGLYDQATSSNDTNPTMTVSIRQDGSGLGDSSDGQTHPVITDGSPTDIEGATLINGTLVAAHQRTVVTRSGRLSEGLVLEKQLSPPLNFDYWVGTIVDGKSYNLSSAQQYAVCGVPFDPSQNKIQQVNFFPNGSHLLVGAVDQNPSTGNTILYWGVILNFVLDPLSNKVTWNNILQGSYTINNAKAPPASPPTMPGQAKINAHIFFDNTPLPPIAPPFEFNTPTEVKHDETITITQNYVNVSDPHALAAAPKHKSGVNGTFVPSVNSLGPVVDFVGSFFDRAYASTIFRTSTMSYDDDCPTSLIALRCDIAGHIGTWNCSFDNQISESDSSSWNTMNQQWDTTELVNQNYTGNDITNCDTIGTPAGCPPTEETCPFLAPNGCTSSSSSTSTVNHWPPVTDGTGIPFLARLGAGPFSIFPYSPIKSKTYILSNFNQQEGVLAVQNLQQSPTFTQKLQLLTSFTCDAVLKMTTIGAYTANYYQSQPSTNTSGPDNQTIEEAFKSSHGNSADVAVDTATFPVSYELDRPYINASMPLASLPQVVTDTHVFTSDPALSGAVARKAIDSETVQTYTLVGSPGKIQIKQYEFNNHTSSLSQDDEQDGTYDNTKYMITDFILR